MINQKTILELGYKINEAWENRLLLGDPTYVQAIEKIMQLIKSGEYRLLFYLSKQNIEWRDKGILLHFWLERINQKEVNLIDAYNNLLNAKYSAQLVLYFNFTTNHLNSVLGKCRQCSVENELFLKNCSYCNASLYTFDSQTFESLNCSLNIRKAYSPELI